MRDAFPFPAEHTEFSDAVHGTIGRLLTGATHFESICKTAALLLKMRAQPSGLDDREFIDEVVKMRPLSQHIAHINKGFNIRYLQETLEKALQARNYIAHELTLGFWGSIDSHPEIDKLNTDIVEYSVLLSQGIVAASLLVLLLTTKDMPTNEWIDNYENSLRDWFLSQ